MAITLDTYSHVYRAWGTNTTRAMEDVLEEDPSEEKGEEDASEG